MAEGFLASQETAWDLEELVPRQRDQRKYFHPVMEGLPGELSVQEEQQQQAAQNIRHQSPTEKYWALVEELLVSPKKKE